MSSIEQLAVILKAVGAPERNWKEAEDRVSEFMNLDSYAKRKALPAMIEEVFPLVFGDEAAVEGSVNFEELKGSPWLVFQGPGFNLRTRLANFISKGQPTAGYHQRR